MRGYAKGSGNRELLGCRFGRSRRLQDVDLLTREVRIQCVTQDMLDTATPVCLVLLFLDLDQRVTGLTYGERRAWFSVGNLRLQSQSLVCQAPRNRLAGYRCSSADLGIFHDCMPLQTINSSILNTVLLERLPRGFVLSIFICTHCLMPTERLMSMEIVGNVGL